MKKSIFFLVAFTIIGSSHTNAYANFTTGDIMICNPGPGMSFENSKLGYRLNSWRPDGLLFVRFEAAKNPSNVSPPRDGECTWKNRTIADNEPKIIRMQARNTLKVMNAFADNVLFEVKVLSGSDSTAAKNPSFLMMAWNGGRVTIK